MLNFNPRTHVRVLLIIVLAFACQNLSAATFPIDIKRQLNGLKIIDRASTIEVGSTVILVLNNLDQRQASCRVSFDPSIEQRKKFKRVVDAGTAASIHYSPGRQVNRLTINIVCKPA